MDFIRWRLEIVIVQLLVLCVGLLNATCATSSTATQKPTSCATSKHREFDFWVGNWDAFDSDAPTKVVARTRVKSILDGCVLWEDYEGTNGLKGQSLSIFDASEKVWHQSWVTDRGQLLLLNGKLQSGTMVLEGIDLTADGKKRQIRGTWKPIEGGVRETAVTSVDKGKTWQPWFDLLFKPAGSSATPVNTSIAADEKAVAALDTQYQAAVEKNDVATMERILADDFVLVTGSGKTYSKSDLLEEARAARTVYEHQDDSEQTVRVWGDTAVVTAKLRAKGTTDEKPFEYALWFSDTYVRTTAGWRYVFGQSSLRLPTPLRGSK